VSSSQLPIVFFPSLLNHDLAAPVRCSCKLYIAVSWFLLVVLLLVGNLKAMTMALEIRRTFVGHGVV
jgi:hypothetical protein